MRRLALIVLLAFYVQASPPMCQCPGGQLGMQCPSPIQLNCPPMQCPPPPPCNPFPTLGTLMPPLGGSQGLSQFTLPTLPPLGGSPFAPTSTPLPLAVTPPVSGQESLVPIQSNQYDPASQQQQQQQQQQQFQQQQQSQQEQIQPQQLQPQQPPQQVFHENSLQHPQEFQAAPPAPAPQTQVSVQPSVHFAETIPVDATTRVTTLPSEAYIEADQPEEPTKEDGSSENFLSLYENQPNKPTFDGFRQPVRRAQAAQAAQGAQPATNGKPEVFTDKCNDERLKRIIEQNVDSNPSSSKRKIQKAATDEIGGLFDVICSSHDFSYLANTQVFCEAGNDDVTCFAFLHSLIQ